MEFKRKGFANRFLPDQPSQYALERMNTTFVSVPLPLEEPAVFWVLLMCHRQCSAGGAEDDAWCLRTLIWYLGLLGRTSTGSSTVKFKTVTKSDTEAAGPAPTISETEDKHASLGIHYLWSTCFDFEVWLSELAKKKWSVSGKEYSLGKQDGTGFLEFRSLVKNL